MSDQETNRHLRRQKELDLRQAENEWERLRNKRRDLDNRTLDLKRQISRLDGEYQDLQKDLKRAVEEEADARAQVDRTKRDLNRI